MSKVLQETLNEIDLPLHERDIICNESNEPSDLKIGKALYELIELLRDVDLDSPEMLQ